MGEKHKRKNHETNNTNMIHKTMKHLFQKPVNTIQPPIDITIFIDLVIAGLQAGSCLTKILNTLSTITRNKDLEKISQKILLGLDWQTAYKNTFVEKNKYYKQTFELLAEKHSQGISPIKNLEQLKTRINTFEEKTLHENISKLSTKITLPLGVCYLPSFILLGLIPIVISSGGNINL